MSITERTSTAVIGGGFYGCMLADHLRQHGNDVVLLEKHDDLMQRASYANQARVHNGYHYPRSLVTAMRSRVTCERFVREFSDCVERRFEKFYAIASNFSKVTARHFENFCTRIGAPLTSAPPHIRHLFDCRLIEEIYAVEEYAFNAIALKNAMWSRLQASGVDVRLQNEVRKVGRDDDGLLLECHGPDGSRSLRADRVYNCTYSQINTLLSHSGLPTIPLVHEVTELALVQMPDCLRDIGVTVMCGPFFSFMPFPARGLHSLSHVRYTPHHSWRDDANARFDGHRHLASLSRPSHFSAMLRDAMRFVPALAECRHVDSLWEIKTILPASDADDSRPILLRHDVGISGLTCVCAGKIDNVFDMLDAVSAVPAIRKAA